MQARSSVLAESMPTCARHFILGLRTETMGIFHPRSLTSCRYVNLPVLRNKSLPLAIPCTGSSPVGLDLEALDLILEGADLSHEIGSFVGRDAGSDNGPGDTTSAAESHLGWDVDVRDVLVLAKEGQVQKDGERGGVGREDDQLADTTVESLGGLVGSLLQLPVVGLAPSQYMSRNVSVGIRELTACCTRSRISWERAWSAWGHAALLSSAMVVEVW